MGTFLLAETTVRKIKKTEGLFKSEIVKVELEFINSGDTSDFTEVDVLKLIMDKLKELKK